MLLWSTCCITSARKRQLTLFGVHVIAAALVVAPRPALEHCALLSSVLVETFHFNPGVSLCFLHAGLEDENLLLVRGVLFLLLPERCLNPLENLDVILNRAMSANRSDSE